MLKHTIIALSITTLATNTYAWKIVYDPTQASNAVKQLVEAKNQLEQLKAQVTQLKSVYQSFNGTRNIVDLLSNPAVVSKLPASYQELYMGMKNAKSGKWAELYKLTLDGKASKNATAQNIREAYDNNLKEYSEAIIKSFDYQKQRITNLQDFASKISLTKDPKEIADLQARISAEKLGLEIDKVNFDLLKQIKATKEESLKQQVRNKWLNSLDTPFVDPDIQVNIRKPFNK